MSNSTIQLTLTPQYKQILGQKNLPKELSIEDLLKKLGIHNFIKAKMQEKKYYNSTDESYGPFDGANEAIEFLKRYE